MYQDGSKICFLSFEFCVPLKTGTLVSCHVLEMTFLHVVWWRDFSQSVEAAGHVITIEILKEIQIWLSQHRFLFTLAWSCGRSSRVKQCILHSFKSKLLQNRQIIVRLRVGFCSANLTVQLVKINEESFFSSVLDDNLGTVSVRMT